jgi:drug/metabolite transporter (DMT)-like permease
MAFCKCHAYGTAPVIILPVSYFAFKEKIGWQAIVGTILAITAVAILFLA